ncbi:MAG TPA: nucleotide exchange factor GrpE [Terriglobia bacterium]|nr:nucleotide exchange factor GrpE [Terriglobia bacterium]
MERENESATAHSAAEAEASERKPVEPEKEQPKLPDNLAEAYSKLQMEKQELYDRLLRKQAEFENFRKRAEHEKEEFVQHANSSLLRSLLPALDGFDRALKHRDPKIPEQFYQGVELIYRQLLETLHRAGLSFVETEGLIFDPEVHQAVETVESSDRRHHEVVEELQRGYKLRQRLLRPALVKVAVRPGQENAGAQDGEKPASKKD